MDRKGVKHALALVGIVLGGALVLTACAPEQATRSASGEEEEWVVSLGDSYISGEGGRWAGNQTWSTDSIDALSTSAYVDSETGERIPRCHRSKSAQIHIGTAQSINLACSGATTATKFTASGDFKPGIDFFNEGGNRGQALMLQDFASTHRVKLVALSIGGNDFNFGAIVKACITAYLEPSILGAYCKDSDLVKAAVSPQTTEKVLADTKQAIMNIAIAMENAGYSDNDWTLALQLYPNVLADPASMRYPESGYNRQLKGGCGLRDADAAWTLENLLPHINATFQRAAQAAQQDRPSLQFVALDTTQAFTDRSLCHNSVHRVRDAGGVQSWKDANAVDLSEWVMEINMANPKETFQAESIHPNYWGQLALRSCWRQVWNNGDIRGGTCVRSGNGLNEFGEPVMSLN